MLDRKVFSRRLGRKVVVESDQARERRLVTLRERLALVAGHFLADKAPWLKHGLVPLPFLASPNRFIVNVHSSRALDCKSIKALDTVFELYPLITLICLVADKSQFIDSGSSQS